MQYNHDRLVIVKRRPEKYSLQLATERRQRRCIPHMQYDRLFHARAEATGKARSPSVERLVDGTTSMTESAERRRRRVHIDIRCPEKAPSKVRRRCSMHEDSGRPERTAGM